MSLIPLACGKSATWLKHELILCTTQVKDLHATCLTSVGKFLTKSPCEHTNEKHSDMRHCALQGMVGALQTLLSTQPKT